MLTLQAIILKTKKHREVLNQKFFLGVLSRGIFESQNQALILGHPKLLCFSETFLQLNKKLHTEYYNLLLLLLNVRFLLFKKNILEKYASIFEAQIF